MKDYKPKPFFFKENCLNIGDSLTFSFQDSKWINELGDVCLIKRISVTFQLSKDMVKSH